MFSECALLNTRRVSVYTTLSLLHCKDNDSHHCYVLLCANR